MKNKFNTRKQQPNNINKCKRWNQIPLDTINWCTFPHMTFWLYFEIFIIFVSLFSACCAPSSIVIELVNKQNAPKKKQQTISANMVVSYLTGYTSLSILFSWLIFGCFSIAEIPSLYLSQFTYALKNIVFYVSIWYMYVYITLPNIVAGENIYIKYVSVWLCFVYSFAVFSLFAQNLDHIHMHSMSFVNGVWRKTNII